MQFQKKTSTGKSGFIVKFLIKVVLLSSILFLGVILVDKINFPYPYKKIEKIVPNENFKVLK